jgi:cytoskeletal protein RodZ
VTSAVAAAQKSFAEDVVPRVEAAYEAAAPRVTSAVAAAQKSFAEDVVPRLETALAELDARRADLAATTKEARKKAEKARAKAKKSAAKTTTRAKRKVGLEKQPRRWPWLLAVAVAAGGAAFALLRRRSGNDDLWPTPSGDGPVPSYREDPVPSSPSDSGKTASTATTSAGDATPPDTDLGTQPQQSATGGDAPITPGTATGQDNASTAESTAPGEEPPNPA